MQKEPTTVAIVQRRLTHYRVGLFESLRRQLTERGVDLVVAYGQPKETERSKNDQGELAWAIRLRNRYITVGRKTLCWHTLPKTIRGADLIVVTQESSIIPNYALQLTRLLGRRKVAFWGHGRNFQSRAPSGPIERWKRVWLREVDWWFAYTQITVDYLVEAEYPASRITCLNNAVDTNGFRQAIEKVSADHIKQLRESRGIPARALIGIYCGSLYREKRLELLISAADRIHAVLPDFHLAIIGGGPAAEWIKTQSARRPWVHVTGALHGTDKAIWYSTAEVVLNPGLVGLGVLDAFAAGVPMITTRTAPHSPEIAYLRHGVNGLVTEEKVTEYADAVIDLIANRQVLRKMGQNAYNDSKRYTVENMAKRFADGIERALGRKNLTV